MTIISPAKNRNYIRSIAIFIGGALIVGIIFIFEYNSLVDIRYEQRTLKQDIVKLQEQNAELKNTYYQMIDPIQLEQLAHEHQLVLDRQPKYLGSAQ